MGNPSSQNQPGMLRVLDGSHQHDDLNLNEFGVSPDVFKEKRVQTILLALLGNSLRMKKDNKMLNLLSYIHVPIYFVEIDLSSHI